MIKIGAFRFTYFTDKYEETVEFYEQTLGLELEHSWERNEHDKGTLIKAGAGLIEVLLRPENDEHKYPGLDYRVAQGAFMVLQVFNIDELFESYKSAEVPFEQEITYQPWGHRSFSVIEPNGLILSFYEERY